MATNYLRCPECEENAIDNKRMDDFLTALTTWKKASENLNCARMLVAKAQCLVDHADVMVKNVWLKRIKLDT